MPETQFAFLAWVLGGLLVSTLLLIILGVWLDIREMPIKEDEQTQTRYGGKYVTGKESKQEEED